MVGGLGPGNGPVHLQVVGDGWEPPLNPPGGGGTFDGMEARIAVLENDVKHIKSALDRLVELPTEVAVLKERVSHLPTKSWMVGGLTTALAIIAALITFGEKLQALLH